MSLEDLIAVASRGTITTADIQRTATELSASPEELLDRIARRIAEGYTSGDYDFHFCDTVMNQVFAYATVTTAHGLSKFAWGIFEAFDQGEFRGEEVTKRLIAAVLSRGFLVFGD